MPVEKYADILAKDKNHEIKAVFATHNETATGVASDIAGVRKALDAAKHPALLFVDGVSSVGSLDMRMGEWGVDCCVSGSQKGFMLPTGLGILAVSQKALDANKTVEGRMNRCYFSFEDMIKTNDLGYFPYTPATQLHPRPARLARSLCEPKASTTSSPATTGWPTGVRKAVDAWGLKLCAKEPKWHSDTVSAILVPEGVDSANVVKTAYYRYNTSLGVGLNKVAGKVFRIGHLGALDEFMVGGVLFGVEMALRIAASTSSSARARGAAAEYFRQRPRPKSATELT